MKTICLHFQIHQPFRLRSFPFFEIGSGKDYFDDELNGSILREDVLNHYLPVNRLLLELILKNRKKFKINFCISGTALDQFEQYTPEVIVSFQELFHTGCVEFIGETYAHSFAALKSRKEFALQIQAHSEQLLRLFGTTPKTFRISQHAYTDVIGEILYDFGFDTVILEGIDNVWKYGMTNSVWRNATIPELRLLINNHQLAEDITSRFSDPNWEEFPLTAEKYVGWLEEIFLGEPSINLTLDYSSLGRLQQNGWRVFEFMDQFVQTSLELGIQFNNPALLESLDDEASLTTSTISFSRGNNGSNEFMCKLGNSMQQEAFYSLYDLENQIESCSDKFIQRDWLYLQSSDHFYYMCTSQIHGESKSPDLSPYESPFYAFINYMNVLSDLGLRLKILNKRDQNTRQKEIQNIEETTTEVYTEPLLRGNLVKC